MAGIRATWKSSLGNTYDLTLDVTPKGTVLVLNAMQHRPGQQRRRVESFEKFDAPLELFPSLDDETKERLQKRIERRA